MFTPNGTYLDWCWLVITHSKSILFGLKLKLYCLWIGDAAGIWSDFIAGLRIHPSNSTVKLQVYFCSNILLTMGPLPGFNLEEASET